MVEFKAVSSERDFMEFKVSDVSKFADLLDLAKKTTANLKDVESQTILFESTPECMYATVSSRDIYLQFKVDGEMFSAGKVATPIAVLANYLNAIKSKRELRLFYDGAQLFLDSEKTLGTFYVHAGELPMSPFKEWDSSEIISFDILEKCKKMSSFCAKDNFKFKYIFFAGKKIYATDTFKAARSVAEYDIFVESLALDVDFASSIMLLSKFDGDELTLHRNASWAAFELGSILIASRLPSYEADFCQAFDKFFEKKDVSVEVSFNSHEMIDGIKIISSIGKEDVQPIYIDPGAKSIQLVHHGENSAKADISSFSTKLSEIFCLDRTSLDLVCKILGTKESPNISGFFDSYSDPKMLCLENDEVDMQTIIMLPRQPG